MSRFAPSPTGRLHLGHGLSAVRAHDLARGGAGEGDMGRGDTGQGDTGRGGGRFLLRIEDIDGARSRAEHVAGILADLAWLGLDHEEPVFQSARLAGYDAALDRLRAMALVYPCFCTRAEIAASLSAPHGPVAAYPGTCRRLSPGAAAARLDEPHAWRLDMRAALERAGGPLMWHDAAAGAVAADPAPQGDVVLARKDAPASYHLAATVDDAAQGVTDIVRGRDLFDATHVHRLLQALLGLPVPRYHHHPLVLDAGGRRLAKRHGSVALADLRAAGMDGRALAGTLRAGRLPTGFSWANA